MSKRVEPGDKVRIVMLFDAAREIGLGGFPIRGTVVSMPRGAGDTACIDLDHFGPVEFNLNSSQFVALVKEGP